MIEDETIISENNFNMENKQRSHNFNSSIEDITNNNNNNSLVASLQGPLTSTKKFPDVSGEIIITNMDSLNNNNEDVNTPRNRKPSNERVRVSKITDFITYMYCLKSNYTVYQARPNLQLRIFFGNKSAVCINFRI